MPDQFVTTSGARIGFAGDDPLVEARRREQIISAQLYALDHLSELLEIASKSRFPNELQKAIRQAWRMTELQAQVIIELQVQRLTEIERLKLRDELKDIREFIAALNGFGNSIE